MHKCITFAPCKYVSECEGPSVRLLKTYKIKMYGYIIIKE